MCCSAGWFCATPQRDWEKVTTVFENTAEARSWAQEHAAHYTHYGDHQPLVGHMTQLGSKKVPGVHALSADRVILLWLVDTGAGYDIVSRGDVVGAKQFVRAAEKPVCFTTANGQTTAKDVAGLTVPELDLDVAVSYTHLTLPTKRIV